MEKQTYGKVEVVKLVKKYGELEHDFHITTLQKRLDDVLEFLNEERVQNVMPDVNGFFYKEEMKITKANGQAYKSYTYNLIDAIFLATLISLYEEPLFKKIRNQKKIENPESEGDKWEEKISTRIELFKPAWTEKNPQKSWEIITKNLVSILYQFILLSDANARQSAKAIQNELDSIVNLFDGLPNGHKIKFYNKEKTRISRIKKELNSYIEDLKENHPDEYKSYKSHQKLREIDKNYQ